MKQYRIKKVIVRGKKRYIIQKRFCLIFWKKYYYEIDDQLNFWYRLYTSKDDAIDYAQYLNN